MVKCTQLRQIQLNYELLQGNAVICDVANKTMIAPENNVITLAVGGRMTPHKVFYGCNGKLLLPTNSGRPYNCITPDLNGVCEVNAVLGYMLREDCTDPEVINSKRAILGVRWGLNNEKNLLWDFCSVLADLSDPAFANQQRKIMSEDYVKFLNCSGDKTICVPSYHWNSEFWTSPWDKQHEASGRQPAVSIDTFPDGSANCDYDLRTTWCSNQSWVLHYPFDGRDSISAGIDIHDLIELELDDEFDDNELDP